jgi:hypothetical protein
LGIQALLVKLLIYLLLFYGVFAYVYIFISSIGLNKENKMVKIISNEEYAKLIGDVDYWKARALKEKSFCKGIRKERNFYENLYKSQKAKVIELMRENQSLDLKLEELEKDKVTFISFGEVRNLKKAKKIAEEFRKTFNNEHK